MAGRIPIVDYLVLDGDEPHLLAYECANCGARYLDRRNACAKCGKTDFTRSRLANEGTVRAFTIVHRAAPGVPTPYVSAVVELEGGGMVKSNIVDVEADPENISLGLKVRLKTYPVGTDDDGTEAVAFGYAPV